jgi:exodeoxyribonuclease V gamma subunit
VEFAGQVTHIIAGQQFLPPLDLDLAIGAFRLSGRIGSLLPDRLLRYRGSKLSARDQIKVWIEHLVLNCSNSEAYPRESTLLMRNEGVNLVPVAESAVLLEELLEYYWQGLTRPLHFFPRSSLAFATKGTISAAGAEWNHTRFPENDDPAYRLCFGQESPFDGEFADLARQVFAPYLACRGEGL